MAVTLHGTLSTLEALQISPPVYPGAIQSEIVLPRCSESYTAVLRLLKCLRSLYFARLFLGHLRPGCICDLFIQASSNISLRTEMPESDTIIIGTNFLSLPIINERFA